MAVDDLLKFDSEKYTQSLHSKYPTVAALQANEKKKSEQIAAATGGTLASYGLAFLIGPIAGIGVGLSGRNLSIASQKRDLIRKDLKERYEVEKTRMSGETFLKNAGLAVAIKGATLGLGHGIEHFCVPPGIDAAPHGFDAAAAAIAHPEHCLEGVKEGMMSELHAIHTLATTGSPDVAAQQAAMQLAYGTTGDNAYLAGAVIGDHAAREVEKGVAKLAVKGGSKLASRRLNNPPTTSKSTTKPTASKLAPHKSNNLSTTSKLTTKPTASKLAPHKSNNLSTTSKLTTRPTASKLASHRSNNLSTTSKLTTKPTASKLASHRSDNLPTTPKLTTKPLTSKSTTTAVVTTIPLRYRTRELKQRPQLALGKKHNNGIANWIIVACIAIPAVAIAFYAPSLFGIWLTILSKISTDFLAFIGYAVVKTTISVMVILSFVRHLLGIITKFALTTILPSVISFVRYGLFEVAKAVLGIFSFIGHLLASVSGFVITIGSSFIGLRLQ
ncbi:MAG: hypothetical protein M1839_002893 [Geoglossum umbratile]|nr:MAG: hypothetical protein M1839_002893 [Geoglossum umbratile]